MKIGIYGGTFNPIHNGHIRFAENCANALGLDKVFFIPTASPPHKSTSEVIGAKHRLAMCRLATAHDPRFITSDIEIARGGVSYTIFTLWEIVAKYPDCELYVLVGSDMFHSIASWKRMDQIFAIATVCTAPRELGELANLYDFQQTLAVQGYKSIVLDLPVVSVSSTTVRAGGKADLLPSTVESYIQQNSLYAYEGIPYSYDIERILEKLSPLLHEDRLYHSLMVAKEAQKLSAQNGLDTHLAYVAGLVHDICKNMDKDALLAILEDSPLLQDPVFLSQQKIWHGFAGAIFIQNELNIYNSQIIEAVRYHSTGCNHMTAFEQMIFLADFISEDRVYDDVENMRKMCYTSMDTATAYALRVIVCKLAKKGKPLFHDTLKAYNFYIDILNV